MRTGKSLLRDKSGAALVVVLCVMLLILALSLSLIYGASRASSLPARRLEQIRAEEVAQSFSDAIHDTLIDGDGNTVQSEEMNDICYVIQTFLSSGVHIPMFWYETELDGSSLPRGCTSLTVSLMKSSLEVPAVYDPEVLTWVDPYSDIYFGYLDVRVNVTTKNAASSVTYHYECRPDFGKLNYYCTASPGNVIQVTHSGGAYYLAGTDEMLTFRNGTDDHGDPVYQPVTDDLVSQSTGAIQGTEMRLYNCFATDRIPYLLKWLGEV